MRPTDDYVLGSADPELRRLQTHETGVIDAAGAGVRRIVKPSALGSEVGSPAAF
ncbi:MAG TPA: hypothetical protein VKA73_14360 [Rubrobacter sp.]|nr:hypothetical protein [Rubrobacter sp.]